MVRDFLTNELTYIALDITIGSVMALVGILAYGRIKKISLLFIVLSGLFLYLNMVFRVLELLNILNIKNILTFGIPLLFYLSNYFPQIFILVAFIIIIRER